MIRLMQILTPPTIGRHALIGDPYAVWQRPGLPEDINGNTTAGIPISANPEPLGLQEIGKTARNGDSAILVEGTVISERAKEQL